MFWLLTNYQKVKERKAERKNFEKRGDIIKNFEPSSGATKLPKEDQISKCKNTDVKQRIHSGPLINKHKNQQLKQVINPWLVSILKYVQANLTVLIVNCLKN